GRYEYDTTVGGPTASVAEVSDLLDCLITVAKDRAFICPEAMEGELSRMAVEHLLGDSSLGHDKRRAGMATIGLQLLLQCRGWKDTLKKYKKEILMLTDDKTFRDGLLKIPLGEGGDHSVDEDDTVNRIADEDRPKVVTVIYRILLGKLSAKGGGIDKH
ncbi:U3 snoRNP protein, partial [Perkinsus olseni]